MRILITGADGFIGQNLRVRLGETGAHDVIRFTRDSDPAELFGIVRDVDAVVHLAGVNRVETVDEFAIDNISLTRTLCDAVDRSALEGRCPVIVFASSTHAVRDTDYGRSKRAAETRIAQTAAAHGLDAHVFRLPNVFGKWCRPNYNSAVATFCHNIARGLPIRIDDPDSPLRLVYIDDVLTAFMSALDGVAPDLDAEGFATVTPEYATTVGAVAAQIQAFRDSRSTSIVEPVGAGLVRALHSTYLSHLDPGDFAYPITAHSDHRGTFAEMLRTRDSGQISFFTAGPGVTRGGHYHHSKTEKFLVVKGDARFRFRHIVTQQTHELDATGSNLSIVETIPGWTHDITNIGDTELLVMLWANEQFQPDKPDTVACPV